MPVPAPNTYPFDGTGVAPANRVTDEAQTLTIINFRDYHYLVPDFAPFYAEGLELQYRPNPGESFVTLNVGVDYYPALQFIGASRATSRPVYGAISFNNLGLEGEIKISYNTVGGEWTLDLNKLTELITNIIHNPRTTTWEQVVNVPEQFPPLEHSWQLDDMVGQAEILAELDAIEQAILNRDSAADLLNHLSDFNNPHRTSKEQVGLGKVMNFSPATIAEAVAGVNPELYVTPPGLRAFFDSLGLDQVLNFVTLQEVVDQISVPKILTFDLFLEFWKLYGGGLKNVNNNTTVPVIISPAEGHMYISGENFVCNTFYDSQPGNVNKIISLTGTGVHTIPQGTNVVKITGRGGVGGVVVQPYVTLTETVSGNGTGVFTIPAGGSVLTIRARGGAGEQSSTAGIYTPANLGTLNNVPPANPGPGEPSWTYSVLSSFISGFEINGQQPTVNVTVVINKNFSNASVLSSTPVVITLALDQANFSGSQLTYLSAFTANFSDATSVTADFEAIFNRTPGTDVVAGESATVTINGAVRTYSGSNTLSAPAIRTDNVPITPTDITVVNYDSPVGSQVEIIYQDYTANGTWGVKKWYSSKITNPAGGSNILLEDTVGDIVGLDVGSTGQYMSTRTNVSTVSTATIPGVYLLQLIPSSSNASRRVFEYTFVSGGVPVMVRVVAEFTPNSGTVSSGPSASLNILGNNLTYQGSPDNNTVPSVRTDNVTLNVTVETIVTYDCPTGSSVVLNYDEPNAVLPVSHVDTVWEISTSETFEPEVVIEGTEVGKGPSFNLTQWKPTTTNVLINNVDYFVRAKWKRSDNSESDWSVVREFKFSTGSVFPPKDTELTKFCRGADQWGTYADGNGGSYERLIKTNSAACGYTTPVEPTSIQATGGVVYDIEQDGIAWRVHEFWDSATFDVTSAGTMGGDVEYLIIGGGGPGGKAPGNVGGAGACGGGGAGEFIPGSTVVTVKPYPVVVGLGGTYGVGISNGQPSSFDGVTAAGGGFGGVYNGGAGNGNSGGSGGGSGQPGTGGTKLGGVGIGQNTHNGGKTVIPAGKSTGGGGGGGGAGTAGSDCAPHYYGGKGGDGKMSRITGQEVFRAAGGGGAGCNASSGSGTGAGVPGAGGIGGGGNGGGFNAAYPTAGADKTGSGGGGGNGVNRPGARGGSGIVIIRYQLHVPSTAPEPIDRINATGGTITEILQDSVKYRVHTFLVDGTFTVLNAGRDDQMLQHLLVAGGGGGGGRGGGGGAGGLLDGTIRPVVGSHPIVVGLGGIGRKGNTGAGPANGGITSGLGFTLTGGGAGGLYYGGNGQNGGSGGGAGGRREDRDLGTSYGGTHVGAGIGKAGGSSVGTSGGGGGGATQAGGNGIFGSASVVNGAAGHGGAGYASGISGTTRFYAAGGGGAGIAGSAAGIGGSSIGGTGGYPGSNGAPNTGSGGGGGGSSVGNWSNAGDGSAGIVIIRYIID